MSLTKTQKNELKKIDAIYSRLEKLSASSGISVDAYFDPEFRFPDQSYQERKSVVDHIKKRRQLFDKSERNKTKA